MKNRIFVLCIALILCFLSGCGSEMSFDDVQGTDSGKETETTVPPQDTGVIRDDVVLEIMNMTEKISVASKSFYPDYFVLSEKLMNMRYGLENGILTEENFPSEYESARRELEQLGYYYDYFENACITSDDGTVYGAKSGDNGPIGGGDGYFDPFDGLQFDHIVTDDNTFYYTMRIAQAGDVVFIPEHAVIDLSDLYLSEFPDLTIPDGITIVSLRGFYGNKGGVLRFSTEATKIFTAASNVKIYGVVIEGLDAKAYDGNDSYVISNGIEIKGTGVEIANCEISGFSGSGVIVTEGDVYIHDCYIHHIRGNGNGNGILVNGGSAKVENNLFSNCRNGVYVKENASVEASNNIEVGNSIESVFRIDNGASAVLKNNTVLGYTQPIILEGVPREYIVENNLFSLNDVQYDPDTFYGTAENKDTIKMVSTVKNNVFNIKEPYLMTWGEKNPSEIELTAIKPSEHPAVTVDYGYDYMPDVVTVGGVSDNNKVMVSLEKVYESFLSGNTSRTYSLMTDTVAQFKCFSLYYNYDHYTELDGVIYGAYVEEGGDPVGGGIGYSEIFTTGDYVVSTLDELVDALEKAKNGEVVYIDGGVSIDVTPVKTLTLGEGVILASNRGYVDTDGNVSTGAVIWSRAVEVSPIIKAGDNSRVSGITLDGKNPYVHKTNNGTRDKYGFKSTYYSLPLVNKDGIVAGNNTRVDNCEIFGFGHAGIHIYPDIKGVRVDHNYIHHNNTSGLGYGICHNDRTESIVEYCLFNNNRHSIAATGTPGTGYIARFNIEMGDATGHNFDMHGGEDRGDGTNIAGTYCEMYNNTFLGRENPYYLRGVPEDYQVFHHNILIKKRDYYNDDVLIDERVTLYDNLFAGVLN